MPLRSPWSGHHDARLAGCRAARRSVPTTARCPLPTRSPLRCFSASGTAKMRAPRARSFRASANRPSGDVARHADALRGDGWPSPAGVYANSRVSLVRSFFPRKRQAAHRAILMQKAAASMARRTRARTAAPRETRAGAGRFQPRPVFSSCIPRRSATDRRPSRRDTWRGVRPPALRLSRRCPSAR